MFTKVIVSSLLLAAAGMNTVSGAPVRRDIESLEKKDLGSDIMSVLQNVEGFVTELAPVASSIIQGLPAPIATPAASILNEVTQDAGGVFGFVTSIIGEFVPQAAPTPAVPTPATPPQQAIPAQVTPAQPPAVVASASPSAVALPGTPLLGTTIQIGATPSASSINLLQTPQETPLIQPAAQVGAISNPTFQMVTLQPTPTISSSATPAPTGSYPALPPQKRDIGSDIQSLLGGLGGAVPEVASVANQFISILPSGLAGPASSLLNVATSDAGLLLGSASATATSTGASATATGSSTASSASASSNSASASASSTSAAPSSTASSGASKMTLASGALAASLFAAFIAL